MRKAFGDLAHHLRSFSADVAEKISDSKIGGIVSECFIELCGACGQGTMFSKLVEVAQQAKSPKIQSSVLEWMKTCIEQFGLVDAPLKVGI